MRRAREGGVVEDAAKAKKITKNLKDVTSLHSWLEKSMRELDACTTPGSRSSQTDGEDNDESQSCTTRSKFSPLPKAPCVVKLIKWKADEFVIDGLKWRDIVSFSGHPLQAWSRVMSRCLQMLVNHLIDHGVGLGFAKMQGVRDQLHAAARLGVSSSASEFLDEDMSDMCWEILASEVQSAPERALPHVRFAHRTKELHLSVSRESNRLDRIGKATAPGFVVVDEHCVTRFVKFNLDDNVLFTAGVVLLAQGGTGVPFGGFRHRSWSFSMRKKLCMMANNTPENATLPLVYRNGKVVACESPGCMGSAQPTG